MLYFLPPLLFQGSAWHQNPKTGRMRRSVCSRNYSQLSYHKLLVWPQWGANSSMEQQEWHYSPWDTIGS